MSNVFIEKNTIDLLANAISDKSGVPVTMTLDEMVEAVDGIESNPAPTLQAKTYTVDSAGTETITADSGYDGLSSVAVSVPSASPYISFGNEFKTVSNRYRWGLWGTAIVDEQDYFGGYLGEGTYNGSEVLFDAIAANTSVTPTESSQTIGGANTMMEGAVTVNAIPSNYVGSGITRCTASDVVFVEDGEYYAVVGEGYFETNVWKEVPAGTAGTPTATKGSVSNHSISVTPSVTNTAGYISGGTINGTAVTVSASELASGNKAITQNGTNIDVVGYSTVSVNVSGGDVPQPSNINVGTATRTLTSAASSISFTGLSGEPTSFAVCTSAGLSTGASPWKTAMVVYDGSMVQGDFITNTNNQQLATSTSTTYSSITFGKSYSNGTLTITGSGSNFQANEYTLVYTYNGSTSDVQTKTQTVGSGATSITFSGLSGTPKYFACIFEGTAGYYSTSSGYQRVIGVVYNGTSTYGVSMGSGAVASTTAWTYTYNNGSLTITSAGTNNGGYFHQATNVNYKLIYVV